MVNGLPGRLATEVAKSISNSMDFELFPYSFSGLSSSDSCKVEGGCNVQLIKPESREVFINQNKEMDFLTVDYTHPSAININGDFYRQYKLPFVMGTTGGDRKFLIEQIQSSSTVAVIAPNMAKQIVAFQAMMQYAAETFPNAFRGYQLEILESHQKGKADVSGTAVNMLSYFRDLGIPFEPSQIKMVREPQDQTPLGIPDEALSGHAWHTYTLKSEDGTVLFQFTHNINGRRIYADGTLDALRFLLKKVQLKEKGKVYSMIDVLKS